MFKKVSIVLVIFVVLVGLGGIGGYAWYSNQLTPVSNDSSKVRFVVPKGSSASKIARDLENQSLIKSALAFKIYTQIHGITGNIFAGEFTLNKNMTLPDLIEKLREGPEEIWVSIPEGLRREEYPDKFIEALGLTGEDADEFSTQFLSLTESKEGYLFPDTYLFPKDATAQMAVNILNSTFDKRTADLKLTKNDVIIASIIERETLSGENNQERQTVVGIFNNRLEIGMPLQADATVQYAVASQCQLLSSVQNCTWWPKNLTRDQIQNTKSPYNTYIYQGLPPAPISNPGYDSLVAAVSPIESDYLYYIHDPEGNIHYGKTLEEHNANVAKYLR